MFKKYLKIAFIFAIFTPAITFGQFSGDISGQSALITTIPNHPAPNSLMEASISSFSTDLDKSEISWFINGTLEKQGIGEKKITFRTGKSGTTINISVTIKQNGGGMITAKKVIRPADVDLIWEAQTYTPIQYRGKALHSSQSNIEITAIPHLSKGNTKLSPSQLIYNWEHNDQPLLDQSGFGKQSIKIEGSLVFGEDIVHVSVSDQDSTITATGVVVITPNDPEILFYEDSSAIGLMYNRPLVGNFLSNFDQVALRAEPFYFSKKDLFTNNTSYQWSANGQKVLPDQDNPLYIRFGGEGNISSARITLEIENTMRLLQEASASFSLLLGNTE